jgi:hypothetical protein
MPSKARGSRFARHRRECESGWWWERTTDCKCLWRFELPHGCTPESTVCSSFDPRTGTPPQDVEIVAIIKRVHAPRLAASPPESNDRQWFLGGCRALRPRPCHKLLQPAERRAGCCGHLPYRYWEHCCQRMWAGHAKCFARRCQQPCRCHAYFGDTPHWN